MADEAAGYDPRDLWSIPFNAPLSPPYPIVYGDIRILTAVYLRLAPRFGAQITLDAGSVSVLSYYREQPAILSWNYGNELPMEPSES